MYVVLYSDHPKYLEVNVKGLKEGRKEGGNLNLIHFNQMSSIYARHYDSVDSLQITGLIMEQSIRVCCTYETVAKRNVLIFVSFN